MEDIWVRRELGDELFLQCNQPGFEIVYTRSNSQTLPRAYIADSWLEPLKNPNQKSKEKEKIPVDIAA